MPASAFAKTRRPAAASLDRVHVGQRLRALRKSQRLTLKALAERSGVALSTLSKIELGQISVSYEKLAAAAHALDADIAQLFDARAAVPGARRGPGPVVVRSTPADAPSYDADSYDYLMLATDFPGKHMTPLLATIVARALSEFSDYVRHAGQEFVMVLAGKVRILFETGEKIELTRRESAYFDSGIGHVYLSTGTGPAQVVVVMSAR